MGSSEPLPNVAHQKGIFMLNKRVAMLLWLSLFLVLASCSRNDGPTEIQEGVRLPSPTTMPGKSFQSETMINNFIVSFVGRTLNEENTVFTWSVRGTGVEPALSHFMVQLPDCAPEPVGFSPTNSVSINSNPNTGIYGVEWHLNVEADDSVGRQYSLTFPGNVPLGKIYSSVISGNETGVGVIPGPCQGYDIAGRVFVDANENGLRDPDEESGIANVIVELIDAGGNISTIATDQYGNYSFRELAGSFTVNLPLGGYPDYFNGDLAASFDTTTVLTLEASVPPASFNNNFGFSPQSEKIITDLENGALVSDGRSLRFWKSEFRAALRNGGGNSVYDAATLLGFLTEIQGLFLDDPYFFTPGNELQEAFNILRSNSREPVDELLAELLATELNQVSNTGIFDEEDLQLVLIAWGEALVAEDLAAAENKARTVNSEIKDATRIFELINTGGGGGIDE
jgi:SdrD B-like domain